MDDVLDPITAVTHPDPWSYYDQLATMPMHRDPSSGMWVIAAAEDVRDVLADARVRVRPAATPVPPHLHGTRAGDVFARLVRMSDTQRRASLKSALEAAIVSSGSATIDAMCDEALGRGAALAAASDVELVGWLMGTLPTLVVARMIGIDMDRAVGLAAAAGTLAAAFAPGPVVGEVGRTDAAAETLIRAVEEAINAAGGIAHRFAGHANRGSDADRSDVTANLVGLFFQNFDATAGLIGNALAAVDGAAPDQTTATELITRTLRCDPPVHNTRRFVHEPARINGHDLGVEDTILLVLAAANRDTSTPPILSFGDGIHLCPARSLAPRIAANAVEWVRRHRPSLAVRVTHHRPSSNARIPVFAG